MRLLDGSMNLVQNTVVKWLEIMLRALELKKRRVKWAALGHWLNMVKKRGAEAVRGLVAASVGARRSAVGAGTRVPDNGVSP